MQKIHAYHWCTCWRLDHPRSIDLVNWWISTPINKTIWYQQSRIWHIFMAWSGNYSRQKSSYHNDVQQYYFQALIARYLPHDRRHRSTFTDPNYPNTKTNNENVMREYLSLIMSNVPRTVYTAGHSLFNYLSRHKNATAQQKLTWL